MGKILNSLKDAPEERKELVQSILSLSKETHYQWRQLYVTNRKEKSCGFFFFPWLTRRFYLRFANLCEKLVDTIDKKDMEADFLDTLLALSTDKVPNVRFVVAKAVKKLADSTDGFSSSKADEIRSKLQALKQDKDGDVLYYATGDLPARLATYAKRVRC